jgi:hypothetical protein
MTGYFRNIFKKNITNIRNCHHEDFAHLVEPAFIGHGVHSDKTQYYRFKGNTELDMTAGRFNKASKFFIEASMKMSATDLQWYLGEIKKVINNKNQIDLTEVIKYIGIIEDRTKLIVEDKTALKLASATYFDENEVLDTYEYEYNLKKIDAWEIGGDYSFFFMRPMSDLLPLPESWKKDSGKMKEYMVMVTQEIGRMNISKN